MTARQSGAMSSPLQELGIPWIEPMEAADTAVFLAARRARFITGVAGPVDGGATPG